MRKKVKSYLIVLVATIVVLTVAILIWFPKTHVSADKLRAVTRNELKSRGKSPNVKKSSPDLVSEESIEISNAKNLLHAREIQQIKFCRERENRNKIVYEFVIEAPTKEQRKEITEICLSVKGLTKNWFSDNVTSWQQELLDQYLLPSEYKYFSVFIDWPTKGNTGTYSILGIEEGKLSYDKSGSPTSSDGYANVIRVGVPFEINKEWRFSHVLDFEHSK